MRAVATLAALSSALLLATGCGVTRGAQSNDMTMLIPNSPGGGYDQTGRAAIAVMENDDITGGSFEVTNVIGAGGSVAMTRLMNAEGDERTMMTAGLGVVGSLYSFGAPYKLDDATPLAQLIEDQEGVLVPADSPYQSIEDLVTAWQDDPGSIVVGGGSSPGGPDHLFPMQLATAVGIDARDVRYVPYDGGGPLTSALLGSKIDVGFSGVGEFTGQLASGEAAAARRLRRGAAQGRGHQRRPHPHGVGHRPGLHQLARRLRAPRHQRRASRRAHRDARGDA